MIERSYWHDLKVLESLEDGEDGERPAFLVRQRPGLVTFSAGLGGRRWAQGKVFESGIWCLGFDALVMGVLPKGGGADGCDQSKLPCASCAWHFLKHKAQASSSGAGEWCGVAASISQACHCDILDYLLGPCLQILAPGGAGKHWKTAETAEVATPHRGWQQGLVKSQRIEFR